MAYFARSQAVKAELESTPRLVDAIRAHFQEPCLEKMGEGKAHKMYRVGQLDSGLWVALRENMHFTRQADHRSLLAYKYNRFCLEAEKYPDTPAFCVGGLVGNLPFLLVEDVSEGGAYRATHEFDHGRRFVFQGHKGRKTCAVDLDNLLPTIMMSGNEEDEFDMHLILNTLDYNTLKYFADGARLDL